MDSFVLIPVTYEDQAQQVRLLRNDCRFFMTRHTDIISPDQQKDWFNVLDANNNKLFLFHVVENGVVNIHPVGYAYIRIENEKILLTGGLDALQRDKGYGKILFDLMIKYAKTLNFPICLEVLKTNKRAFSVYNKLGFKVIDEDDNNFYMEL